MSERLSLSLSDDCMMQCGSSSPPLRSLVSVWPCSRMDEMNDESIVTWAHLGVRVVLVWLCCVSLTLLGEVRSQEVISPRRSSALTRHIPVCAVRDGTGNSSFFTQSGTLAVNCRHPPNDPPQFLNHLSSKFKKNIRSFYFIPSLIHHYS